MTLTTIVRSISFSTLAVFALTFIMAPASASAAVYAYVDVSGEVKTVTANDWMTAIAIAPGIHINSGVMTLTTAADYTVVGDDIPSIK